MSAVETNYKINGRDVRARDVQLLFADLATGAHSTAMVNQGRVGTLIGAKPTQRRGLLEEAAGIKGLHSRRHEAELRLRAAETNLERLDDVIVALEGQFQGLKRQARQAARYRRLGGYIRRHEAIQLHLRWQEATTTLESAREDLTKAEAEVNVRTAHASEAARLQAEIAAKLPDLRQAEAEAAAELQRLLVAQRELEAEEAECPSARSINASIRSESTSNVRNHSVPTQKPPFNVWMRKSPRSKRRAKANRGDVKKPARNGRNRRNIAGMQSSWRNSLRPSPLQRPVRMPC